MTKRGQRYPVKVNPLFGWWIVVNSKGVAWPSSLALRKRDSIAAFLNKSTLTWRDAQRHGWHCVKVDVNFER